MNRKLIAIACLLALVSMTGCSGVDKCQKQKDTLAKAQSELKAAASQCNNGEWPEESYIWFHFEAAQKAAAEAESLLIQRKDYWWDRFDGEIRRFDGSMREVNNALKVAEKGKGVAKNLQSFVDPGDNPRLSFHLREAREDLRFWDAGRKWAESVETAEAHFDFATRLKEHKAAVPSNTIVELRDRVLDEGDIDSHDGDSPRIKAHLRQAAFCVSLIRTSRTSSVNELAASEFRLVHDLRRNKAPEKKCSKEENWDRRDAIERVALFDRLVVLGQEIEQRCPKTCPEVAMLQATKELYASAVTGDDREQMFKEVAAAIERLEDGLLRFKKCGK
jgi:hypothetical protein